MRQTDRRTSNIPIRYLRSAQFIWQHYTQLRAAVCSSPLRADNFTQRQDSGVTKRHAQFNQFVCPSASDVPISLRHGSTNAHSTPAHRHTMCTERLPVISHVCQISNKGQRPEIQSLAGTGPSLEAAQNVQNEQTLTHRAALLQDHSSRQLLNYAVKVPDTSQSITHTDRPLNIYYIISVSVSTEFVAEGHRTEGQLRRLRSTLNKLRYPKFRFDMRRRTVSKRAGQHFE